MRGVFVFRSYQANLGLFPLGMLWFDWKLDFKLINWGHGEAMGGRDLIFGLKNGHIMNRRATGELHGAVLTFWFNAT